MKLENSTLKTIRVAALPLAISLLLATFTVDAAGTTPSATNAKLKIVNYADSKANKKRIPTHKQIVKEGVDAFKATQSALKALDNNNPKEALAALEVVSGNLHLLIARDPALDMIPIDTRVQIIEGLTDLKMIKQLEDELDDLIDDGHYQAARPIVDSLVDEMRITTTYLPLATYPAAIDKVAPLIDAGKINEAKEELMIVLDTFISEQEITPLAILRAEESLTEAFQLEHKGDLSNPETKNKIEKRVKQAEQYIKVAQTLGYGTKNDYEPLHRGIHSLNTAISRSDVTDEWAEIKKSISAFKNKIVHPRGK